MATGQGILDRLKKARETPTPDTKPGVLPLAAYYGLDPEREALRNKMYAAVERALAFREEDMPHGMRGGKVAHWTLVDFNNAIALVNANASPIEFLVSRGEMETGLDLEGMAGVRFHTALRLRDLIDGSRVNGLKSPSLEGGGGGGGKAADIRGYQLDCIKILGRVKSGMTAPWMFATLEAVVVMDDWLDLWPEEQAPAKRKEAARKRRLKTIKVVHYLLDRASVALGYLVEQDFTQRWGRDEPSQPPAARRHSQESRAANQLALLTSRGARKG